MCWRKRDKWKASITLAGMLLLLVFMVWVPVSVASAYERVAGLATPVTGTVQATPPVDATITALNKEKLLQDVDQQQHTLGNWLWNNGAAVISSLVLVIAGAFTLLRYLRDQRNEREKQRAERQTELEKRAEERFQSAVSGLGDEKEEARIGAAILLRTFLRPGYEQFYTQTFDLAVAHLRLPRGSAPPDGDPDTLLPLTTLRQALIVVFKEAFPLARSLDERDPQALDASRILLDNAYFVGADLKQAWMPRAFLRKADLSGAHLEGAHLNGVNLSEARLRETHLEGANLFRADLSKANLSKANLSGSHLNGCLLKGAHFEGTILSGANLSGTDLSGTDLSKADLRETNLHRVKGLTKEQLKICKAKGAIIDQDSTTSPPQSLVSLPLPLQSNNESISAVPPVQGGPPTPDTDGSSTPSSQPKPELRGRPYKGLEK